MTGLFTLDSVQHLHWQIIKSILFSLFFIPVLAFSHQLWTVSQQSDQIFIIFFSITLLGTWLLLSFIQAVQLTYAKLSEVVEERYQALVEMYQLVPLLFFTALILGLSWQCLF